MRPRCPSCFKGELPKSIRCQIGFGFSKKRTEMGRKAALAFDPFFYLVEKSRKKDKTARKLAVLPTFFPLCSIYFGQKQEFFLKGRSAMKLENATSLFQTASCEKPSLGQNTLSQKNGPPIIRFHFEWFGGPFPMTFLLVCCSFHWSVLCVYCVVRKSI